jgi:hypothetical protein
MVRTSHQLAALGVTIALSLNSGSAVSPSKPLHQDELEVELVVRIRGHPAASSN